MKIEIELSELNALLQNLHGNANYLVHYTSDSDHCFHIYKIINIPPLEGVYLKVSYHEDSYGENNIISAVKFVIPTEKVITVFE